MSNSVEIPHFISAPRIHNTSKRVMQTHSEEMQCVMDFGMLLLRQITISLKIYIRNGTQSPFALKLLISSINVESKKS